MKNRTTAKILFCAIITITCFNDCGTGNKSQQKADTSTETLEVSDLETKKDSLNLPDSAPAVSRDSRLVNAEGEMWITHGDNFFTSYIFRADGRFDFDVSGKIGSGKWFTDKNGITIIDTVGGHFGEDGFGITEPYTVSDSAIKIGRYTYRRRSRDSRLVNAEGEAWLEIYNCDGCYIIFRADGSFVREMNLTGTWYADGNNIIMVYGKNESIYTAPYTLEIDSTDLNKKIRKTLYIENHGSYNIVAIRDFDFITVP